LPEKARYKDAGARSKMPGDADVFLMQVLLFASASVARRLFSPHAVHARYARA